MHRIVPASTDLATKSSVIVMVRVDRTHQNWENPINYQRSVGIDFAKGRDPPCGEHSRANEHNPIL